MNEIETLQQAGVIAAKGGNHDQAIIFLERAIELDPESVALHYNLGNVYRDQERFEKAEACYLQALRRNPTHAPSHNNLGLLYQQQNDLDRAKCKFQEAISHDPKFFEAHFNLGNLFYSTRDFDKAVDTLNNAQQLNPSDEETVFLLAKACLERKAYDSALAVLDHFIEQTPNNAQTYVNRGVVASEAKRPIEALKNFKRAIELDPNKVESYACTGSLLMELGEDKVAQDVYEKLMELKPDFAFGLGMFLHAKLKNCSWCGILEESARLINALELDENVAPPFGLISLTDSPSLLLRAAKIYARANFGNITAPENPPLPLYKQGQKIKLGYFSADFYGHATCQLMARVFELHDRSQFEVIAFSMKNDVNDAYSKRIRASFDQFIEIDDLRDQEVAELSRKMGIHIAVDLKGYTKHSRPAIFAYRAAPIQINYLGYPGTIGAEFMDYMIADEVVIPNEMQKFCTEKVLYLPDCYQPNDDTREISGRTFSRAELGLPEDGFVFCCFNNNYKITPFIFDIWCHILESVPGSVLWLLADTNTVKENLSKEAASRGINPNRLVFAPRMPMAEHLSRIRQADLFLDTLPCNAHTTASDALWAEVPVLTCAGEAFHARVATSLLHAVGLPELCVDSIEKYIETALSLARDQDKLRKIRNKLAANRETAPLFDSARYTKNLESAYRLIYERQCEGLNPDHIYVTEGCVDSIEANRK